MFKIKSHFMLKGNKDVCVYIAMTVSVYVNMCVCVHNHMYVGKIFQLFNAY